MENNKLIAEFMRLDTEVFNTGLLNYNHNNVWYEEHELSYNVSWDWLMPVVEKCRVQSNAEDSYWEAIYYSLEGCDIDVTHHAVVEFISNRSTEQQM
jgi:hypothetical protein